MYKNKIFKTVLLCLLTLFSVFSFAQTTDYILSEGTSASFSINEVLLGNAKTVIGTTTLVTGSIQLDMADLNNSILSPILIDAASLETDNRRRNASLQKKILEVESYPVISFEATGIEDLQILESGIVSGVIRGELQVKDVVREVAFGLELTTTPKEITGTATTTINYKDFNITIPAVPMVASVEETVILTINFKAIPNPEVEEVAESMFAGYPILVLGESLYQQNCVACHGANGEGYANAAMPAPAVNGSEHAWHHRDEQILGLIQNGGPNMPAVGANWTQEELDAVWIYVKHWWTADIRATHPGDLGEAMLAEFEANR